MKYSLTLFCAAVLCRGLSAQTCPIPEIIQTQPSQQAAQVVIFGINNSVDSVVVYLGDESFRHPRWQTPDTTYSFSGALPDRGYNLFGLEPATNYVAIAQTFCNGEAGPFSNAQLFRTTTAGPPRNDLPAQAEILAGGSVRCNYRPGSTRSATGPDREDQACSTEASDDVWYRLRAIYPGYEITLRPVGGTDQDLVLQLYDENRELIACVDDGGPGEPESYVLDNLEKNAPIDVRVSTAGGGGYADFEICNRGIPVRSIATAQGCTDAPTVTVDGTGESGVYVPVVDERGNIIAGIENTEALGSVSVSYYGHPGDTRVIGNGRVRYASRNVTIVPDRSPAAPIGVRLYLNEREVRALITLGAIESVDDLDVTGVGAARCSRTFPGDGYDLSWRRAGRYGDGYFVEVDVQKFGEFFIHPMAEPLATTTSTTEFSPDGGWRLFPNPVGETLNLVAPPEAIDRPVDIQILDSRGSRVLTQRLEAGDRRRVHTAQLPPGVYTALVNGGKKIHVLKFVR